MARYRITITSQDREAMLDLVRTYHLNVFDHGSRYSKATGYSVDSIADTAHIDQLKDAGYQVQTHKTWIKSVPSVSVKSAAAIATRRPNDVPEHRRGRIGSYRSLRPLRTPDLLSSSHCRT